MLRTRVLSSLGLLVPGVGAVYLGGPFFHALVALCAAVLVWEWLLLCRSPRASAEALILAAATLGAVGCAAFAAWPWALGAVAAGAPAAAGAAWIGGRPQGLWVGGGVLYIGLPVLAVIWLRADPVLGLETMLWLLGSVVATDVGAYAAGKTIGGPRLAPAISPHKTWAGLSGGMVCAAAVGVAGAVWLGRPAPWAMALAGAGVALVAQAGDLVESQFKRHFGVKDTSAIIPGHGGLFDRVDGMIAAAVAVAAWRLVSGGSILAWL